MRKEMRKGLTYEEIYGKERARKIRNKMSESRKGQYFSEETKRKISEGNKGKHLSEETKKKISEAKKGITYEQRFGEKRAKEMKEKLSVISKRPNDGQFKKGQVPWIKGKHHTKESIEKHSEKLKEWYKDPKNADEVKEMRTKQNKGRKKHINKLKKEGKYEEYKKNYGKKVSKIKKGVKFTEEHKQALIAGHYSKKPCGEKVYNKIGDTLKKKYASGEINFGIRVRAHHTGPELRFEEIVKKYNLPYKYVGNGQFWMGHPPKNPDFINVNGEKKVVEIHGVYWHLIRPQKEQPNLTREIVEETDKKHYAQYGFDCIILWEDELKDDQHVLNQIGITTSI